ncbi:protein PXR1 [Cucumis melo var. makuwa]|uniref:Protein PXR1 n=1 Tax=Cucumis melo var. makuwa TaxID=1194695 RepID=A0A5D3BJ58_CUCMM|nr:protein PXR1 [Cucumis melo var. makuwa]
MRLPSHVAEFSATYSNSWPLGCHIYGDKKDPTKLRQKLEKLEAKMQALAVKKEEILKLLHEAEQNPPPPS